jgi:hypothetical protein
MPETLKQISFAKLEQGMGMPHLLDIQTRAFEALLQLDAASHDREPLTPVQHAVQKIRQVSGRFCRRDPRHSSMIIR